jgi:hypothetical protein
MTDLIKRYKNILSNLAFWTIAYSLSIIKATTVDHVVVERV